MQLFPKLLLRPWTLYADFSGRSRRSEYWLFLGIRYGVFFPLFMSMPRDPVSGDLDSNAVSMPLLLFSMIWLFGTTIPAFAVTARRLHDANLSGKWLLASFIPYIGLLATPIIGLLPGTPGENDKGFDPRIPDDADDLEETFS